jgi:hypothetical protein
MNDWQEQPTATYPARPIPGPRRPTREDCPDGYRLSIADNDEIVEAGWPPTFGMTIDREGNEIDTLSTPRNVLRSDGDDQIVALWAEGRWWTPFESSLYDHALRLQELARRILATR